GARELLPEISLTIDIHYDKDQSDFGPLSNIILDLDPNCESARALFRYSLPGGKLANLFDGITETGPRKELSLESLLAGIGERIPQLFERTISAIDPGDETNVRAVSIESIRELIKV